MRLAGPKAAFVRLVRPRHETPNADRATLGPWAGLGHSQDPSHAPVEPVGNLCKCGSPSTLLSRTPRLQNACSALDVWLGEQWAVPRDR